MFDSLLYNVFEVLLGIENFNSPEGPTLSTPHQDVKIGGTEGNQTLVLR